ncbi:hypothetical protein Tco_0159033 [Tanacetum coccineum]
MKLNFEGQPMPLLVAMLSQAGKGAGVDTQVVPPPIPKTIFEPMPEFDQPQDHVSTPPRPPTSDPLTSTNVEDEPLGGSFHASPPRSTQASLAGHTSGGVEYPITLTDLSSVVSTLVQKVNSLETELKAHKKLFKDVVGKLVKEVKAMEVKIKIKKRKVVMSDSDKEDGGEQDVDLDALHALANAAVTVDSTKSPGGASSNPAACSYDPTSDVPTTDVPTDVPSSVAPPGASTVSPGSTTVPTSSSVPAAETIFARSGTTTATPSSPVKDAKKGKGVAVEEPTLTQDKTFKQLKEERLDLSSIIFGVDFTDDDFAAKMVALNQGPAVYTTGWTMAQVRKLSLEQLQEEFDKIQRAVAFTRGLKRDGSPMTTAFSKKLKPGDVENISEAQAEVPFKEASVEDVELLGRKGIHTSQSTIPIEEGDPDAEHKLCIKYASDEDSASDCDTPVHLYAVVDYELLPTGADLMTIYGRVMMFYQDKKAEGVGLVLWGDLRILIDLPEVNDGISGLVIHMFVDKKYPLTINLIERMLDHQLEICHGTVGNEITTAVQLIAFLKKQISDSKRPKVHEWYVVPTGKDNFIVSTDRPNMVPAGRTIVSPGSIIAGPGSVAHDVSHCEVNFQMQGTYLTSTARSQAISIIGIPIHGIANNGFIQLGGGSRVDEMILARERSGFAEEKVWGALPVVTGFWGGKEDFLGELAAWSPEDV